MKKFVSALFLIALSFNISPAQAVETRIVTDVSAYYRVDLGYMVGWKNPVDTKGITSYTVTANPTGKTCVVRGATSSKCVFANKDLGYVNSYSFTVVANSSNGIGQASAQSNTVKAASIPYAPQKPLAMVKSDTSIDIAWVPDANDGGASIYGYRVNIWESQANGDPGVLAYDSVSLDTTFSATGLKPSTLYVVNVASCNAYGCNSADKWTYISTTGPLGASNIKPPVSLSGGNPSTTCWNRTVDAGDAASLGLTINKNSYTCSTPFVDPVNYPKVVPGATTLSGTIQTKFDQSISFSGFAKTYSIAAWSATGGNTWGSFLFASSKAPVLGFTIAPTVNSLTPNVCTIDGKFVKFITTGTCKISASIGENSIWKASKSVTTSFDIVS